MSANFIATHSYLLTFYVYYANNTVYKHTIMETKSATGLLEENSFSNEDDFTDFDYAMTPEHEKRRPDFI